MLLNTCKDIHLAVNTGKTKYMKIGRHRGMNANEHIGIGSSWLNKKPTNQRILQYQPFNGSAERRKKCDQRVTRMDAERLVKISRDNKPVGR